MTAIPCTCDVALDDHPVIEMLNPLCPLHGDSRDTSIAPTLPFAMPATSNDLPEMVTREEGRALAAATAAEPDEIDEERVLVATLSEIRDLRDATNVTKKRLDTLEKPVRTWLTAHPEPLFDGETRLQAWFKEKAMPGGQTYDLISMRKSAPALFERLFETGCLSVNNKAVEAQAEQVAGVSRYAMPAGVTKELKIERVD